MNEANLSRGGKKAALAYIFLGLILGFIMGGYLFSKTQQREFFKIINCQKSCLKPSEFIGLLASVGIQKFPSFVPKVIVETDKTLVLDIQNPPLKDRIHYVVIPKKDIKNIAEVNAEDEGYLLDAFHVMAAIVKNKNIQKYRILTNGPGYQQVTYLHFHLMSEPENP